MVKRAWLVVFTVFIILTTFAFLQAQITPTEEEENVDKAYSCLEDKTTNCDALSTEEKIFSLLAIDQCQAELVDDSSNNGECWPDGNCRIKTTAQAVLALDNTNANTEKAEAWLLSQNKTPTEIIWYLEIEADGATTCTIDYAGTSNTINIREDKTITNNAGSCLVLAQDDYWLRISPTCFDEEFEVSCDQPFLTTLLFQKSTSTTIHVSEESSSASAGGTTIEKVESSCFAENDVCTYEGSLWAALVLDSLGRDISAYLPYLITFAEDNARFLPESFLYFITGNTDYRTTLLGKQKSSKWWQESGDKYYDTALALYPFQNEEIIEKTNSKEWLFEVQDENGCWENNIRNTAFLLSSVWPRGFGDGGDVGLPDCEEAGYFCTAVGECGVSGGEVFSEYDCPALFRCCSTEPKQETCAELGGDICTSGQICRGGDTISTPDLSLNQECCIGGVCEAVSVEESECEANGGICRTYGCNDNEEESPLSCEFSGDFCCIVKTEDEGGNYLWIWILLGLIVLVIIGIIFRDKLRHLWLRTRSKFGKSKPGSRPRPPGPPRRPPPYGMRGPMPERRILLPGPRPRPPPRRPAPKRKSKTQKELDDVLKKLKDTSK